VRIRLPNTGASARVALVSSSAETVERLFAEESGRAIASLIRLLGDFDLAEEAVQDAFVVALQVSQWPMGKSESLS
jgi:predicted RNA polymerase sigma factor